MSGGVKSITNSEYSVTLYELLKAYSTHVMRKNFQSINIAKLPVCTTEEAISIIKSKINLLDDWKEFSELIPSKFMKSKKMKKSGMAGLFSASLELTKEGLLNIMQENNFDKLLIKKRQ